MHTSIAIPNPPIFKWSNYLTFSKRSCILKRQQFAYFTANQHKVLPQCKNQISITLLIDHPIKKGVTLRCTIVLIPTLFPNTTRACHNLFFDVSFSIFRSGNFRANVFFRRLNKEWQRYGFQRLIVGLSVYWIGFTESEGKILLALICW